MKTLRVNLPGREYDIKIEKGIFDESGSLIAKIHPKCKAAIITDSNVGPLYAKRLIDSLENSGFSPFLVTVPAGESSKSIEMLEFLYSELLKQGITRTDLIIALGGGVVGDLTGFCAATLLRGIPFIQIPTTLLAQVDSSVGGKVAVNLPHGKNLVGAFYQPKMVIIDPLCLETLSDRNFSDGMAEVIKYGVILDEHLFCQLEKTSSRTDMMEIIDDVVLRCCDLKRMVVEDDETDTGGRMILNFGHTFGHAIEKKYNFTDYTHGEAVAAGMVMAAELGEKWGITLDNSSERIRRLIKKYNLPDRVAIDKQSLADAVAVDKKGKGNTVALIVPEKIGKVIIKDTEKNSIWTQ
ncbi:MAG: 3-dehydroquinate synthase [Clostridia bacterium]|nr:3-dehydroquinate synthase [Clostridia bacterium]